MYIEGHFQHFSQARRGGVRGEAIILLLQPSPAPRPAGKGLAGFSTGHFFQGIVTSMLQRLAHRILSWKARPNQKEWTMRDNLRRYRAIQDALTQGYPGQPPGAVARHGMALATLISGMVGSKSTP